MATLVTSLTFVSYPGAAYGKDWSLLVPGLLVSRAALWGPSYIPFYRRSRGMSAYEYSEANLACPHESTAR